MTILPEDGDEGDSSSGSDFPVVQLHFTGWPDRGVPSDPALFLNFLHTAMAVQNAAQQTAAARGEERTPPLLVHCSAGVGRTGVFILVYAVLTYLPYVSKGGKHRLSVKETVQHMRTFRRYLVQTIDQVCMCVCVCEGV